MSDESVSNGPGGDRDGSGRFVTGNRAGRGNPHVRRLGELQGAVREAGTPERLREVLGALHARAVGGDPQAARTWLERVLGRAPEQQPDIGLELGDLTTADGIAEAMANVTAAAAAGEVPLAAAQQVVGLLERTSAATLVVDLERRLTELEKR